MLFGPVLELSSTLSNWEYHMSNVPKMGTSDIHSIGPSIRMGREILCLPYAGFFYEVTSQRGAKVHYEDICLLTFYLINKKKDQ